jgi:hypothetical protein
VSGFTFPDASAGKRIMALDSTEVARNPLNRMQGNINRKNVVVLRVMNFFIDSKYMESGGTSPFGDLFLKFRTNDFNEFAVLKMVMNELRNHGCLPDDKRLELRVVRSSYCFG